MSTESAPTRSDILPRGRMWFCVWGAAICWVGLSIASSLIAWRACLHQEQFGGESSHPGLLILNMVLFFLLLAVSIAAGLLGYRYWRRLSGGGNLFHAESPERREYMVMVGVLITVFVGVGIIWFGLPLWLITICARVR